MAENATEALESGGDATASATSAATDEKKSPEMSRRRSSTPKAGAVAADDEDSDADDGFEDASSLGGNRDSPRSEDIKIPTAKTPGPGELGRKSPRRKSPDTRISYS